jgi:hypothetical protein
MHRAKIGKDNIINALHFLVELSPTRHLSFLFINVLHDRDAQN